MCADNEFFNALWRRLLAILGKLQYTAGRERTQNQAHHVEYL